LAVRSPRGQLIDHDPIAVRQMLLWLGRDHASPKWPFGNEADFLVIVMAGTFSVDAPESIPVDVVSDQLRGYKLSSLSGIQTAGDDQQKRCSLQPMRVDDFGSDQVVRLPRDGIVGRDLSEGKSDGIGYARSCRSLVQT